MRVTVYEAAVYPQGRISPELNVLLLIDTKRDELEVQRKNIFVHIDPKPTLTKFSVEAKQ